MASTAHEKYDAALLELCSVVVEQCAAAVEGIPVSTSLYQNSVVAGAVKSFQRHAVLEIRSLLEPAEASAVSGDRSQADATEVAR